MNLFRLSPHDNFHLYDSNLPVELEYLLLDKYTNNAYLNQSENIYISFPKYSLSEYNMSRSHTASQTWIVHHIINKHSFYLIQIH